MDLGRAISIHPSNAGNYFLRGDCHCKLGNYEQVIQFAVLNNELVYLIITDVDL
jgi:hypothetical protein